jgi:hypothetical protein
MGWTLFHTSVRTDHFKSGAQNWKRLNIAVEHYYLTSDMAIESVWPYNIFEGRLTRLDGDMLTTAVRVVLQTRATLIMDETHF